MRKRSGRVMPFVLAAAVAVTCIFPTVPAVQARAAAPAYNESNASFHYFYNQLGTNAQGIYRAMEEMFSDGGFARGENREITDKVTASSMAALSVGNQQIFADYGAARDAFQYDYPDCFYVDWDDLAIHVTRDRTGAFHCFLGAYKEGTTSYLLTGFGPNRCNDANWGHGTGIEGAVEQYEEELNGIVEKIKNDTLAVEEVEAGSYEGNDKTVEQIGLAHDYLVKNMIYRHEEDLTSKDRVVVRDGKTLGCQKYANSAHKDEHGTSRTAYDALIYQAGVCEAYTRAFKAILDRLGIPCVCVSGVYSPKSTINEPHIWNYVLVNGKWYGVDVTHDDPTNDRWWLDSNSTHETREYWLVGQEQLMYHHFPSGIMSAANYEFTYPDLSRTALRESYSNSTADGLSVIIDKDYQFDDQENSAFASGTVYVSYKGENYTQNAEKGNYIIARAYMYEPGKDHWKTTNWFYIDPWTIAYLNDGYIKEFESETKKMDEDTGEYGYYTRLEMPQVMRMEFAVTDVAPAYTALKKEFQEKFQSKADIGTPAHDDWVKRYTAAANAGACEFQEAEDTLQIRTDVIDNKWGNYVAPPTCTFSDPSGGFYIEDGKKHIRFGFDDKLVFKTGESVPKIGLTATSGAGLDDQNAGSTAVEGSKIEGAKVSDDGKYVEFDFTPSTAWADDYVYYTFQIENMVGQKSNKAPYPVTLSGSYRRYCNRYLAEGEPWGVYAQPQLMDSNDLDISDWTVKDNLDGGKEKTVEEYMQEAIAHEAITQAESQDFLDAIKKRLTLVTMEPSPNEGRQMEEAAEEAAAKAGDKIEQGTINTYNISLSINEKCPCARLRDGMKLRVCLGFPKGTSYEDYAESGRLTFKAYHYVCDPDSGKLTGEVEECPVTVTKNGLIIMVDSFSPFAVAAAENESGMPPISKTLVVSTSNGGYVSQNGTKLEGGAANLTVEQNGSVTVKITPDDGFAIESVLIGGKEQEIANSQRAGMDLTVPYSAFDTGDTLSIRFMQKAVVEQDIQLAERLTQSVTIGAGTAIQKKVGDAAFPLNAVTSGDGKLSYSADSSIISVSADGIVSIKDAGTAHITVTAGETASYHMAEATATVTVSRDTKKKISGITYNVTKAAAKNRTVEVVKADKKKNVKIPATVKIDNITYKVTAIGPKVFANNSKLQTVTLGKNISSIGKQAFYNCTKLKSVQFSAAVTKIGDGAFRGCRNMKTVSIPASSKMTSIGAQAFYKCTKLKKAVIPAKVKKIGKRAFYGCSSVKEIRIETKKLTSSKIGAQAFKNINKKATIRVPEQKYYAYRKILWKKGVPRRMWIRSIR